MLLTRVECEQILQNLFQVKNEQRKLIDYRMECDNSAIGYLGDYYDLTLYYSTAGSEIPQEQRLFVKALPQQSDEVEKEAIFRKESYLYESVISEMQKYSKIKWSANCYYTRSDLFVLENVKLSGYCAARGTFLNELQLQQLLRSLAAFHAASIIYEERRNINIGCGFGSSLQEITIAPNIAWFTTGLSAILAILRSLPQYQSEEKLHFIDFRLKQILERIYEQISPSHKYRNVICHRDLWAGNIFFPTQAKDAVLLIDFQTSRYTPPAIDLCFSLYLNLTTKERLRLERSSIDFYYNCLQKDLQDFGLNATELIPKAQILQSYEEFRLFGTVYNAVAATIVKVPTAFVTNDYKYVDRSVKILKYMRENAEFRDCMERCCVEVMEIAANL